MENKHRKIIAIFSVLALIACIVVFAVNVFVPKYTTIIDDDTPLSGGNAVSASFYLYNPSGFKAFFTSVVPSACEYVGDGYVIYNGDVYNSPTKVSPLITQEADYWSMVPEGKAIQWGSLFKHKKKIVVIGLLIDNPNPVVTRDMPADDEVGAEYEEEPVEETVEETKDESPENEEISDDGIIVDDNVESSNPDTEATEPEEPIENNGSEELAPEESETPTFGAVPEASKSLTALTPNQKSVMDYGAVGDGVTDDSPAINRALKDCKGSSLYIPSGKYLLASTVHIPSDITIYGDGDSSIFIASAGFKAGGNLLSVRDVHNVFVSDLVFNGNSEYNIKVAGNSTEDGIHLFDIWSSYDVHVDRCNFIDNINTAIRVVNECSNISVDTCNFIDVDCGVITMGSGNIDTLTVSNSFFDGHSNSEPVSLFGTGVYSNITIHKNIMKNKTYGVGVYCAKSTTTIHTLKITENQIYDLASGINIKNADDVLISGNTIDMNNTKHLSTSTGISLNSCSKVTITNNSISNTRQQGLYIDNCNNTEIYLNTITNCGYANKDFTAVDFRHECNDLEFHHNTLNRTDDNLNEFALIAHCSGSAKITDNTFDNCKIRLWKDSSNLYLEGNNTRTLNNGKNNIVK